MWVCGQTIDWLLCKRIDTISLYYYITPKNTEITIRDSLSKKIYKTNIIVYEFSRIIKGNSQTSVKSTTYIGTYLI